MAGKKQFTFTLKLAGIQDKKKKMKDKKTKEIRVVEVRKVLFKGKHGISITYEEEKSLHKLRDWSDEMFYEDEDMVMMLELPGKKQLTIPETVQNATTPTTPAATEEEEEGEDEVDEEEEEGEGEEEEE